MMRILWTKEAEFGARAFRPRSVRAVDRVITCYSISNRGHSANIYTRGRDLGLQILSARR